MLICLKTQISMWSEWAHFTDIPQKYTKVFQFIFHMNPSRENDALALESLQQYFTLHPEDFEPCSQVMREILYTNKKTVQQSLARRHLHIFSQLLELFWLYENKARLDDYAFSISKPKAFADLKRQCESYQKHHKKILWEIQKQLENCLYNFPNLKIEGRYKNLYSIYRKLQKKNSKDISDIGDIFAFRIITQNSLQECYDILAILHGKYKPNPKRFKDYIKIPKVNGYQSLHTWLSGILTDPGLNIEIQIRTQTMHEISLYGNSAHAIYSSRKKATLINEKEKKLLEHLHNLQKWNPYIYISLKDGFILKLPEGTNAIEAAEKIHSKFPNRIHVVNVNGELSSLNRILKNFDILEFITY